MKNKVTLFQDKKDCCGCGTCSLVCPKNAIQLKMDSMGYKYPVIDYLKCINCKKCIDVCAFSPSKSIRQNDEVYAVSYNDEELLNLSASGGVYSGFAAQWIKNGGVVVGAELKYNDEKIIVCHSIANTIEDLKRQLGSKYVQSDLNNIFIQIRELLRDNIKVLFSGTPCQVDSLYSFLGRKYDNLLTMDIICHGVPSQKLFQEYIAQEERKLHGSITDYRFRDKKYGCGLNAKICYKTNYGEEDKMLPSYMSSYYELFLNGDIYRENCYTCPYANDNHPADLTIGDFWGIEEEYPDFLLPKGKLDKERGISILIINTDQGKKIFDKIKDSYIVYEASIEKAKKHNEQLNLPSKKGNNREIVMNLYKKNGYEAIENWYCNSKKKEKIINSIKRHIHQDIPEPVRRLAKQIIRRK